MFIGIIVFLLILTIILFPIPLKITLKCSNKVLEIYIYNKKLKPKLPSKKDLDCNPKENFIKSLNFNDMKLIIYKIRNLKLKPRLILNTKIEYGFDDAALVAILFGLIHTTYSFIYLFLINFVKVKNIDLKVIPHFEENDFNLEILSIIYMNLVKIIYMAFIMSICLIKIKHEKTNFKKYKGGNVHG
jgi:hypothetical protein